MSANFFGLLEDVSSNDPAEIAKKRQQDAAIAKKQQEKKQAEEKQAAKKDTAAKKTTQQKKPLTGAPRQTGDADVAATTGEGAFEQRDNRAKRGGRGGRGGKHHVAPRTGRQFDRESGTGRGKEISKNGGGARNWGRDGDEAQDVVKSERKPFHKKFDNKKKETETPTTPADEEKKDETTTTSTPTGEESATTTATTENKTAEPEEEEDNSITYDKLLAEKRKASKNRPQARKAGEGVTIDPALLKGTVVDKKKATVDVDLPVQEEGVLKKKAAATTTTTAAADKKQKKPQSHDSKLSLNEFFKGDKDALDSLQQAQQYRPPRSSRGGGRGGSRGRGNNRGGGRGGSRGRGKSTAPQFNTADFPSLK